MLFEEVSGGFFQINSVFIVKLFLLLFLIFYAVFALTLYRQIQLMSTNMQSPLSPLLKFVAILHIGVSLTVLFLVLGTF